MVRYRTTSVKVGAKERDSGENVLFKTWLVSRSAAALVDRVVADAGLTADEFAVYSVLRAGAITPTELASWMAAPPTTISSSVRRLESRGHVQREANPDDRRSYRLTLTAKGRRAHQHAQEKYLPLLDEVESALGRAQPGVLRALDSLRAALDRVMGADESS